MSIAVVGDVHGHLQLALCVLARWQVELGRRFEAVFLCGDVGTFTEESQLDSATRGHGRGNPCELEFLRQWSIRPQAPWLAPIFRSREEGGLGLDCPVVMVHGNHEGFAHLSTLVPARRSPEPVDAGELPPVDSEGHLRLLPSGWRTITCSGLVVGGIGGMERHQRRVKYHEMAYLDEDAVGDLGAAGPLDLLITHQGPAGVQGNRKGSKLLQVLLDREVATVWCHGHAIPHPDRCRAGPGLGTLVVPLGGLPFDRHGPEPGLPGTRGWVVLGRPSSPEFPPPMPSSGGGGSGGGHLTVVEDAPSFLGEFRRQLWTWTTRGELVCPPLAGAAELS